MEHLAERGVNCPQPVRARNGEALGRLAGRAAAIVTFLDGLWVRRPKRIIAVRSARRSRACTGRAPISRCAGRNALSIDGWPPLFAAAEARADEVAPGLAEETAAELDALRAIWPTDLPSGVIHADFSPTTSSFSATPLRPHRLLFRLRRLSRLRPRICLNAWCFEPDGEFNISKGMAMIEGYQRVRPLSGEEVEALPVLARGSALRFMLTRLVDWLNVPPGALVAPKNPLEYLDKLRFHQRVVSARDYGWARERQTSRSGPTAPARAIPVPAAGARSCATASKRERIVRRRSRRRPTIAWS